ncbi:males-absent on the first protein [Drosophila teissieri]|uniref:males-absent on the first protein n=1 Tax=Drosophila teissieri TaxID=7243 RepID=UPI001CBA490A|nr:males-absent on the first protein [Drosophila teissieri]
MDKENRPGDHVMKQPLGDQEEKSPEMPDFLKALNLIRINMIDTQESSAISGSGHSSPKTVTGSGIQAHRSGAIPKKDTKVSSPLQEISNTPKKQLEGTQQPNVSSTGDVAKMGKSNSSQLQETSDTKNSDVKPSSDQEEIGEKEEANVEEDPVEGRTRKLQIGRYEIETTYSSSYPEINDKVPIIYVCEFCLKYMCLRRSYSYHLFHCKKRRPSGSLVYQKDAIHIYEVDGSKEKLYCQCLCLMSKLFLKHKETLYSPKLLLFYILCLKDKDGEHLVGYFAREKKPGSNVNLNCILVLPPYMRQGYGKLLIALSYEISRKEGVIGGPKKPLSEVGRLCYLSYWGHILLELLRRHASPDRITIEELSRASGFLKEDVILTLKFMKITTYYTDDHIMCTTPSIIENRRRHEKFKKPRLTIQRKCLVWKAVTSQK